MIATPGYRHEHPISNREPPRAFSQFVFAFFRRFSLKISTLATNSRVQHALVTQGAIAFIALTLHIAENVRCKSLSAIPVVCEA